MSSESAEPEIPLPDPTIAGYAASDGYTTDDTLGFKPYVVAIASFLTAQQTEPPSRSQILVLVKCDFAEPFNPVQPINAD